MTPRCVRCGRFTTFFGRRIGTQITGPDDEWLCEEHAPPYARTPDSPVGPTG